MKELFSIHSIYFGKFQYKIHVISPFKIFISILLFRNNHNIRQCSLLIQEIYLYKNPKIIKYLIHSPNNNSIISVISVNNDCVIYLINGQLSKFEFRKKSITKKISCVKNLVSQYGKIYDLYEDIFSNYYIFLDNRQTIFVLNDSLNLSEIDLFKFNQKMSHKDNSYGLKLIKEHELINKKKCIELKNSSNCIKISIELKSSNDKVNHAYSIRYKMNLPSLYLIVLDYIKSNLVLYPNLNKCLPTSIYEEIINFNYEMIEL